MYRTEREREIVDLFGSIDETDTNVSPVTLGRRIHGRCIGIGIGIGTGECIRIFFKTVSCWKGLGYEGRVAVAVAGT